MLQAAAACQPGLFAPGQSLAELCQGIDDQIGPGRLYPIGFSIPKSLTIQTVQPKTKDLAGGQSRGRRVYQYGVEQEAAYHADYQQSRYGLTYRKGGFDCMRHLEILANGCLPFFPGHRDIPALTMAHCPKPAFAQAMDLVSGQLKVQGYELVKTNPDADLQLNQAAHDALAQAILDHVQAHQTTEAMARYVLQQMRRPDAKSVLFLGDPTKADHLSNLLFHGFRSLLGANCVDGNKLPWMYDNFPAEKCNRLHGRGFTYARKLEDLDIDRSQLKKRLAQRAFDLVVFGSIHRHADLLHHARTHYDTHEIALIDGEDWNRQVGTYRHRPTYRLTTTKRIPHRELAYQGVHFKREFDDAFVIEFDARNPSPRK